MPKIDLPPPIVDRRSPAKPETQKPNLVDGLQDFVAAIAGGGGALAGTLLPAVMSMAGMGGGPLGLANSLTGALSGGGQMSNQQMLMMQYAIQQESQRFQMASNVSKTEHDAKMNAIRNVRP